jgi:hypothetical protein
LNPYLGDPGLTIIDEKLREDSVRNESWGVSRWVWAGLDHDAQASTARMIQQGMERSRTLYTANRTVIAL